MYQPIFEGDIFSYSYENETDQYMLSNKNSNLPVFLKGDDAFFFKEHIAIIKMNKDKTLKQRIERGIEIHYCFETKPCPIPIFNEQ
jgi:hypothetical protein